MSLLPAVAVSRHEIHNAVIPVAALGILAAPRTDVGLGVVVAPGREASSLSRSLACGCCAGYGRAAPVSSIPPGAIPYSRLNALAKANSDV